MPPGKAPVLVQVAAIEPASARFHPSPRLSRSFSQKAPVRLAAGPFGFDPWRYLLAQSIRVMTKLCGLLSIRYFASISPCLPLANMPWIRLQN